MPSEWSGGVRPGHKQAVKGTMDEFPGGHVHRDGQIGPGDHCDAEPVVPSGPLPVVEDPEVPAGQMLGVNLDTVNASSDRLGDAERVASCYWDTMEELRCLAHPYSSPMHWNTLAPGKAGRMVMAMDKLIAEGKLALGPNFDRG